MPADLATFNAQLSRFTDTLLPEQARDFVAKIAFEGLSRLVLRTRVRTGRLRGGYTVSLDNPTTEDPGRVDPSGSSTISAGLAALSGLRPFQDVVISNPVSYTIYVNNGTEHFEGDFMFERTVEELAAIFS